ncbi:MAG: hypothetical protein ACE5G2_08600 [Candidatus Krumholzibacteriia bacterium]
MMFLSAVGVVSWRLDAVGKFKDAWHDHFRSGIEVITGQTAVDLGQRAKKEIVQNNLARALDQYESLRGKGPDDLEELVREGLLQKADLVDEWGRSLQVEANRRGIVIRSAGPDGRLHTKDDWVLGG